MTLTPLADDVIERFASVPAANVADAQERFGVASGLVPMWTGARLAGPALTVWTRPGDNLYIHHALDLAQPGDIIVINGLGDVTRALIGDLIGIRAKSLGVGGFVIDGAVRDADALAECGMPVFARAVTPAGPYKHGPGRLQQPVAIAGVVVLPGRHRRRRRRRCRGGAARRSRTGTGRRRENRGRPKPRNGSHTPTANAPRKYWPVHQVGSVSAKGTALSSLLRATRLWRSNLVRTVATMPSTLNCGHRDPGETPDD